jgi:hypothetical protein
MSYQIRSQTESETTIERIFLKVVGRKMTPEERVCLQLKNGKPSATGNSTNGAGVHRKNGSKLTRS